MGHYPLILDYIIYKLPVATNTEGEDITLSPWQVIFRDARTEKDPNNAINYFALQATRARPASTIPPEESEKFSKIYKAQQMDNLDILFETNQSITFTPGKSGSKSSFSGVMHSSQLSSGVDTSTRPSSSQIVELYEWLESSFFWETTTLNSDDVEKLVRTGRTANGEPIDTSQHDWWNVEIESDKVEIWDSREWGFASPPKF